MVMLFSKQSIDNMQVCIQWIDLINEFLAFSFDCVEKYFLQPIVKMPVSEQINKQIRTPTIDAAVMAGKGSAIGPLIRPP